MRISSGWLLSLATLAMVISLIAGTITVAGGRYWEVFGISIAGFVASGSCCWVVFRRGGWARWVAVAIALASLLAVLDWVRRLPGMRAAA